MWSTADCSNTRGEIKFTIKGNSYIITPSVINEALHFPESNFENVPAHGEISSMLEAINFAGCPLSLSQILKKNFRKEWSHFFDTLNKCFAAKCSSFDYINTFILKIAHSLLYGKRIDFGKLLFDEFSSKFGDVQDRDKIIYYARFLMIIANYLCKDICIQDTNDTLQVHMQSKKLFAGLVTKNLNANVEFVLPDHVQVQLSMLSSALSHTGSLLLPPTMEDVREGYTSPTQVALPSPYQSGTVATFSISQSAGKGKKSKRKRATFPPVETRDDVPAAPEVHLPQEKKDASKVSSLPVVDQEMPPAETRDGVPAVELPSPTEEEEPIRDLIEPAQEPDDHQYLINAASVLKSRLVAVLTSNADKLSTKEMITLSKKCYNTLQGLGIDCLSFSTEVNKMIAKHQEVEFFSERKEKWKEDDIMVRQKHQVQCLSEVTQKLSSAEDQLSASKTNEDSLKLKREELRGAILKLTEELSEVEERVKILTAERDQWKEAHSVAEAELGKLDAEKEEALVAYREINDKYNASNEEQKRMSNQLLQLVRR
ncbi:hypothetical protein POM88_025472 [Heracleum sosnowskyi]|uniref:Uncharacterized protein n=1 Tax=Heracleum sosnowskyi TaxID=360622 RepID=A0AAD8I4N8_9APIA|nr:hypothetical protein POM88_025472 [Heracleum sosnowskyi]